jgi:D-alanyl-D-alanine-carboxypeptidase/D-alanyl-D-alanine-endopeptidase
MQRREFLLGSMGTGIVALRGGALRGEALRGGCFAEPATDPIRDALKQAVGTRDQVAGMIAVVVDEAGTRMTSYGSSGVPNLAMDGNSVFEIMSITKVLTSLLLADMAARGEVAMDDPVAKYLPPSVTLHEYEDAHAHEHKHEHKKARPITLLDLATYTSGLPNMPGNLPPDWYAGPKPMADYTEAKLYEFLSSYVPKYEPGTHYEYANLSFGLLGIALARRAGKSYEELLIERVCGPLGLDHTRITLTAEMRRHLVQGHDLDMKPTQLWDWPAMPGAGYVRSTGNDLTVFLKACMGLAPTPLSAPLGRLLETRRATPLAGTDVGLGWFISSHGKSDIKADGESDGKEEIVWKSGLSTGCNSFIGFSTKRRRGAVLLSNFLWQPIDAGTINMGLKMINPDFPSVDFHALYI